MTSPARVFTTWDVHIAYPPPAGWDELEQRGTDVMRRFTGESARPSITIESIGWDAPHMTPRWLDQDSSRAVAALQPSIDASRGTLAPLLTTEPDEVVAAVWTSPDHAVRHYIVPWLNLAVDGSMTNRSGSSISALFSI